MTGRSHCRVGAAAAFVPDRFISQFGHAAARAFKKVAVFTQVVRDHAEADPAGGAVDTVLATASQTVASFEHTDAAFAADASA